MNHYVSPLQFLCKQSLPCFHDRVAIVPTLKVYRYATQYLPAARCVVTKFSAPTRTITIGKQMKQKTLVCRCLHMCLTQAGHPVPPQPPVSQMYTSGNKRSYVPMP